MLVQNPKSKIQNYSSKLKVFGIQFLAARFALFTLHFTLDDWREERG